MLRRLSVPLPTASTELQLATQMRFRRSKPKKRPKIGPSFPAKVTKWRDEYLHNRNRMLADSLRSYVDFCSTKRTPPWDARFAPFDRTEKDGVHIITKHFMDEKLQLVNYHSRATKRLLCNVGLVGPTVTTKMRWMDRRYQSIAAGKTTLAEAQAKQKNIAARGFSD